MHLFKQTSGPSDCIAIIADLTNCEFPAGIASAAFDKMRFVESAKGHRAFWVLLERALSDSTISAVAVSLNSYCVFDNELPSRLDKACASAAGGAAWAVLAATGKCVNGMTSSVVYPSASPRLFTLNIPQPIVDCGLELFVLNANFLRAHPFFLDSPMVPESFAHWCILTGYLENRLSIFRPELAIGVDGAERGRDLHKHIEMLQAAFGKSFHDETLPSLMGELPIGTQSAISTPPSLVEAENKTPREVALTRPIAPLADLVRHTVEHAATPMSLSVITRTQFARGHLVRRMLSSLTRARLDLNMSLEVVLTTDIDADKASTEHKELQAEFPELDLVLKINQGHYPHSRVDNLVGGILAARKDYIAIVDDDDFVDLDALKAISTARFLGQDPLLLMSSQVRNETWLETTSGRWILESSTPEKTYYSDNYKYMFTGSNQLPVCAMIAPREWIQERLRNIELRHDLSEDYTIYLALLCAPDLPPLLIYADVFCMISSRSDGSNTITMKDRRPWVRDITLFLHDLFVGDTIPGTGAVQLLGPSAQVPPNAAISYLETTSSTGAVRQAREIAMLRAEVDHLRRLVADNKAEK